MGLVRALGGRLVRTIVGESQRRTPGSKVPAPRRVDKQELRIGTWIKSSS